MKIFLSMRRHETLLLSITLPLNPPPAREHKPLEDLMRRTFTRLALLGMACGCFALPLAAQQYTITNLGDLTGFSGAYPQAINNSGQVAGNSLEFSGGTIIFHAWRTEANAAINPSTDDLGVLSGATNMTANGINSFGQVVGDASGYSNNSGHGWRADPGTGLVDLGLSSNVTLPPGIGVLSSSANSINDAGQVAGSANIYQPGNPICLENVSRAFRTQPNGLFSAATNLGTIDGNCNESSFGFAINYLGQVVGYSTVSPSFTFFEDAFLANPGQAMQHLGTLGGNLTIPRAINATGNVVGQSNLANNAPGYYETQGFEVTLGSAMRDIGTLGGSQSYASSINKAGQIVGNSTLAGDLVTHAFLYQNGSMYDLNNLIPANSGWILTNAGGINDLGQIVGNGTLNGVSAAFRLDLSVAAGTLPPSGDNCNGTYNGTFNQSITVSSGQICRFLAGSKVLGHVVLTSGSTMDADNTYISGNVDNEGGDLDCEECDINGNLSSDGGTTTLNNANVSGNTDVNDTTGDATESLTVGGKSVIRGNVTIQGLVAGTAITMECGANILGNLYVLNNGADVTIGQGTGCAGNTVGGSLQVQNNTGIVTVVGNTVSGNIQCSNNTSIVGSGNTAKGNKQGQCAGF